MKKVGFIGAYDKTNLIMCLAKILAMRNKKVLIVDTTAEQKCKYIIPAIHPSTTYITTWEDIDVAVGFNNIQQLYDYVGVSGENMQYDFILMNIDNQNIMRDMRVQENNINCFVTAMDLYSMKKGIEIFKNIEEPMKLIKVIFSRKMSEEDIKYIEHITMDTKMEWDEKQIVFPLILDDKYVEMDNQLIYRLGLREISTFYKESLAVLTEILFGDEIKEKDAKKIIKTLERKGI